MIDCTYQEIIEYYILEYDGMSSDWSYSFCKFEVKVRDLLFQY